MTILQQLEKAGIPLDCWQSDLYAKVTSASEAIINDYEFKDQVRRFRSCKDGSQWFEIPFANDPFWEAGRSK